MRTAKDRLRHTLCFEIIALIIVTPASAIILNKPMHTMGIMSICMSLWAMTVNLIYNYAFDLALLKIKGRTDQRSPRLRLIHSILFEATLVIPALPVIAWWLDMTILNAFIMDLGFMGFFMVYAYIYNLAYDRIFPIAPEEESYNDVAPIPVTVPIENKR
ncbi:MAG: PACE efflux transporter [Desulfovibrio sp.]